MIGQHLRHRAGARAFVPAVVAVFFGASNPAGAQSSAIEPFTKGTLRVGAIAAWASTFSDDYLILGLGVGYYFHDAFEAGIDLEGGFFGDPSMWRISPELRYVLASSPKLKPYIGGFYRRSFIEELDDRSALGYRIGAFYERGPSYVGFGLVQDFTLNCDGDCSNTYPEFVFSLNL